MPNDVNPASLDAERFLLGVLIRDGKAFPTEELQPVDFYEPSHQDIAHAIVSLQKDQTQVDELTINDCLNGWGVPITAHFINSLTADVGFTVYNPEWAR